MSRKIGLNSLGIILALIWIFPVYWMVNTAFLPESKARSATPTFVPFGGDFSAFGRVLGDKFFSSMKLSLSITLIVVAVALVFAFLSALAVSRFRFAGRKGFILLILVVQMTLADALFISHS